ncbi:MAG: ATP-binding protein [Acidobacteriaceae bacterium]|nr:ATP-binding protein [Acidobacteriaceae bacterium]
MPFRGVSLYADTRLCSGSGVQSIDFRPALPLRPTDVQQAERYERGSVLISSNLPFSKWEGICKDPMTTTAAIDRLVHHCVILELNIPSYRVEQAKKAQVDSNVEYKKKSNSKRGSPLYASK